MNRCSARLLYAPQKVTPSPLTSAGLPEAKITPGVRTRWRIGVPGAWHSQQSHPTQSMNPTRILTVLGFGETANLKSPTLRIPPRLRGGGCQPCLDGRLLRAATAASPPSNFKKAEDPSKPALRSVGRGVRDETRRDRLSGDSAGLMLPAVTISDGDASNQELQNRCRRMPRTNLQVITAGSISRPAWG